MGLRDTWNDLGTGGKVLIGLVVGGVAVVALLIAIVVIAAVVGTFVLGLGGQTTSETGGVVAPPSASLSISQTDGTVTIRHQSGDALDAERVMVSIDDDLIDWSERDGTISVGDDFTAEVDSPQYVDVLYETSEGTRVIASREF